MENLKEYVVTAASYEVLDDLCNDIESPGGNLYIPKRAVSIANLRPMSRNTHYYLTDEEADLVRKDPRVIAVEQLPETFGARPVPLFSQTETWNKSTVNASFDKNWGLLRCFEGKQRNLWGYNGTIGQTGTIDINDDGTGVDIVIVDGHADPSHPEYAVNINGTGGSRVVQYNWYELNPIVLGTAPSTYTYTPYVDPTSSSLTSNNVHGSHVAGTAAGNTQGWARGAKIYNLYPYSTKPDPLSIFDYIRAFHKSKPIDPTTGKRRPTITNNSWGYSLEAPMADISEVYYRGIFRGQPYTSAQLASYGMYVNGLGNVVVSFRYPALDADIQDAIKDGIIVVAAAGNDYSTAVLPGHIDYNNYLRYQGFAFYYHRGSSPGAADNVICVGAVGLDYREYKANFSNCGPRVDVFAPGQYINSSVNTTTSYGGTVDPRNSNYYVAKISGTSMAAPQVTGVLACALSVYPGMTQSEALDYVKNYSILEQIGDTGGGYTDYTSLQGATNRYLAYNKERKTTGSVYPKNNFKSRPLTGTIFPRTRISRYGR